MGLVVLDLATIKDTIRLARIQDVVHAAVRGLPCFPSETLKIGNVGRLTGVATLGEG